MHRPHQPNPALQTTQALALLQLAALTEWERTYRELLGLALVVSPFPEPKPAKRPLAALIAEKTPAEETVLVWKLVIWRDVHIYDQKIFDDRGSWVKAPNLRTIAMTGVSVAMALAMPGLGTALTGVMGSFGAGVATAAISATANIAVDAGFTAADVAGGYMSANDAWGSFGKRALISGATSMVGATAFGGSGFVSGAINGMGKNFGTAMLNAGLQAATNKLVSSTVNAMDWEWGLDWKKVGQDWSMTDSSGHFNLANYSEIIGSVVSAGISTGLNDTGRGFLGEKWNNYQKVGAFAGNLASSAITYGLTGHTSFNVLNIADFIPETWKDDKGVEKPNGFFGARAGLLELSIDAQHGSSLGLGGGGMDISYNALQGVAAGLAVWKENATINNFTDKTTKDLKNVTGEALAIAMRASASGDGEVYKQYADILAGKVKLADGVGQQAGGAESVTDSKTGEKTIFIGSQANNKMFDFAVVLAHEAMRDGLTGSKDQQQQETVNSVMSHMSMAFKIAATYGGDNISASLLDEVQTFAKAMGPAKDEKEKKEKKAAEEKLNGVIGKYSSEKDFWLVVSNPLIGDKLIDDGSDDLWAIDPVSGEKILVKKGPGKNKASNVDGEIIEASKTYYSTTNGPSDKEKVANLEHAKSLAYFMGLTDKFGNIDAKSAMEVQFGEIGIKELGLALKYTDINENVAKQTANALVEFWTSGDPKLKNAITQKLGTFVGPSTDQIVDRAGAIPNLTARENHFDTRTDNPILNGLSTFLIQAGSMTGGPNLGSVALPDGAGAGGVKLDNLEDIFGNEWASQRERLASAKAIGAQASISISNLVVDIDKNGNPVKGDAGRPRPFISEAFIDPVATNIVASQLAIKNKSFLTYYTSQILIDKFALVNKAMGANAGDWLANIANTISNTQTIEQITTLKIQTWERNGQKYYSAWGNMGADISGTWLVGQYPDERTLFAYQAAALRSIYLEKTRNPIKSFVGYRWTR